MSSHQNCYAGNHMLNELSDYVHGFLIIEVEWYDEETGQYFGYIESLGEGHWEYFTIELYRNNHTPLNK